MMVPSIGLMVTAIAIYLKVAIVLAMVHLFFGKGLTAKINSLRLTQKKNIVFEDINFDYSLLLDYERNLWR